MTAQEFFKNDLFAENAGVVLLEVRKGYSKAKLEIKPEHLNAGARTQGPDPVKNVIELLRQDPHPFALT